MENTIRFIETGLIMLSSIGVAWVINCLAGGADWWLIAMIVGPFAYYVGKLIDE